MIINGNFNIWHSARISRYDSETNNFPLLKINYSYTVCDCYYCYLHVLLLSSYSTH